MFQNTFKCKLITITLEEFKRKWLQFMCLLEHQFKRIHVENKDTEFETI